MDGKWKVNGSSWQPLSPSACVRTDGAAIYTKMQRHHPENILEPL
jgi:hypothetical protein